ncbi:MAG: ISKra4 family transposase [Gammaproteobacteria bacterium]|nr:ISKra4 family transposase [Gammaproteobacteria bacterium]
MSIMNEISTAINAQALVDQVKTMVNVLEEAFEQKRAAHEVEHSIFRWVMQIGRRALRMYFQLYGNGDQGETVELPEVGQLNRLDCIHRKAYQSVFGEYALDRVVYGSREGQKIEYVPLDEQLQLPQSEFSYLLQDWNQSLAVEMPYNQVSAVLQRILGISQSINSLERNNTKLAVSVPEYWEDRAPAPEAQGKEIVVVTVDCKGVVIRKASAVANQRQARIDACQATMCGEQDAKDKQKKGRKKMAVIGSTYTIAPYVRTPEQVVEALFRDKQEQAALRPKPLCKYIRTSLRRDEFDTLKPAYEEIFGWLADEHRQRNPQGQSPSVLLMDGQRSLWEAGCEHLAEASVIEILDLLHATSYVWKAAAVFHPGVEAEKLIGFVKPRVARILKGEVKAVIRGFKAMGTLHGLSAKRLKILETICGYFENNAQRMRYDQYLVAGYPIATGVIEGACRHVVKDRMERSGMRWTLPGAQAMLGLRCISLNGDWDEYMKFHIRQENHHLYPRCAVNDSDYNGIAQVA